MSRLSGYLILDLGVITFDPRCRASHGGPTPPRTLHHQEPYTTKNPTPPRRPTPPRIRIELGAPSQGRHHTITWGHRGFYITYYPRGERRAPLGPGRGGEGELIGLLGLLVFLVMLDILYLIGGHLPSTPGFAISL